MIFLVLYFMIYCWLSFWIVSFLYCILWFTVVFRTVRFCPCPSYFYFFIVFLVIHVIKAINRGLCKLLRLLFIFQVFYWQKLKNIRLKIPQGNKIWKFIECNFFSPWYSWSIAHCALSKIHSPTHSHNSGKSTAHIKICWQYQSAWAHLWC
jgi:hypothetical protein